MKSASVCVRVASRNRDEKVEQQNPPFAKRVLLRVSRYFFRVSCFVLIVAIVNSAILHRHVVELCVEIYFGEILDFFVLFFFSSRSSRDVNLACLLKTSGEKQTYFAYDLFAIVHAVAADEFLMAHNTEVKIAGFRGREN